jgi:hypothetical protein
LWYLKGALSRENRLTFVGSLTSDALTPICRVYCITKLEAFSAIWRSNDLMTSEILEVLMALLLPRQLGQRASPLHHAQRGLQSRSVLHAWLPSEAAQRRFCSCPSASSGRELTTA